MNNTIIKNIFLPFIFFIVCILSINAQICPITAPVNEKLPGGTFGAAGSNITTDTTGWFPTGTPFTYSNSLGQGHWVIGTNPSNYSAMWYANIHDHTTGTGNMLILDANNNTGDIYNATVTTLPNTTYYYSAWFANIETAPNKTTVCAACPGGFSFVNSPVLVFLVNGVQVGATIHVDSIDNNWHQFYAVWTSTTGGPTNIQIRNLLTDPNGNDLALDDISFNSSCTNIANFGNIGASATLPNNTDLCTLTFPATLNSGLGAQTGYTFAWKDASGNPLPGTNNQATYSLTSAPAIGTKYYVCYQTPTTTGCPRIDSTVITDPLNINITISGPSNFNNCVNPGPIPLSGTITGSGGGGVWSSSGTGTFSSTTSLSPTYTPSAADLTKSSIYVYLTSTATGACPTVKDSMKITFFAGGPTVNAGPAQSACANNPTVTLAGSYTVATGIVWSGGAGTFVPNNTTKNATYTPTAAEITAGSVTLTLTTTGNGICPAATGQVTLTYTPAPTVNAGTAPTVCANNGTAVLLGTTTGSTGVSWTGGTGTFSAPANVSTNYTPSAAELGAAPTTVALTLTAVKAGCTPVTSNVTVTITPKPTVNAGPNVSICKNDSANLAGSVTVATGGTWSGGTGKFSPNANTLTANYKPSAAELAAGSVTLKLTTTGNGTCSAVSSTMKISFTPAPTVSVVAPASVCANNPVITAKSTVTNATGQAWQGSGGAFVPNTTAATVQYTPTATEIFNGITALVVSTTGGTCPPVYDTIIININPAPTVSAGPPVSVCANNPTGALTGSVTGVANVAWSSPTGGLFSSLTNPLSNYTATATDIANGSVLLTATASKAGCNPVSANVTFTITPAPTVNAGPSRIVCANKDTATFNGSFTGATGVSWTAGNGTFSAPASAVTSYIAGTNDITAGKVIMTLTTTGNGNCLAVSDTATLTITPKPVVAAGGPYTVCANNAATALNGTVSAAATGGIWSGGAGTFAPGNNVLNPVYTPTPAEASAGSLTLTLQSTGNGTCNPVSATSVITFTPAPALTPVTPVAVCADFPAATISTTKTVATGVQWTGGTGSFANSTALSTTYTPSLAEITSGTASLTVTTTGNGTCSPVSANVIITIAPAPTVNAGPNQVVCGTVATVATLSGTVTGASGGKWTNVNGTGTIANASSLTTTYTPSGQDIINGSVTLKLTSTGNGLCQPVSATTTITYTPEPSINAGPNQIVCSTEMPVSLAASGSPAQWNTAGGTFGNVTALTTTYTPSAGEISAGSVTLSISTIPSGACPVKTSSVVITIPAGPVVNPGPDATMCGSLASFALNGVVTNATGGFWTTSGTGTFTPNANTLNAQYVPSATDRAAGTVTITLTSTGNGSCLQQSKSFTLTITPAITVSAGPNQTLCADVAGITLNGSVNNASGGTWTIVTGSGSVTSPNSPATTYIPSAGDISSGTVALTLTSTGNAGCPAVSSNVTFTLTPAPTLNQGGNQTICADSAYVQLNAAITVATGVKWTSSGTGSFTPDNVSLNSKYIPSAADMAAGTVTLTATTTGNGTCNPVVKSLTVTITPAVTLAVGSTQNICANNSLVNLNATLTVASVVNWTSSGTGTFANQANPATTYTPSVADMAAGLVTLTVKSVNNGTCKAKSAQVQVTIAPAPIVNAGLAQIVCANTAAVAISGTVTHAAGGTWTSAGSGTFANPNALSTTYSPTSADTTAGSVILTLTSTGNATCTPVANTVTISFQKVPVVTAGPNQVICADSAYVQLNGAVTNAGGGIWSATGTGTFSTSAIKLNAAYVPTAADKTAGLVTYTLTSTSNGTCPAVSASMSVKITTAPTVSIGSNQNVCANNPVANFTGTFSVAGGIQWTTSGTGAFAPNTTTPSVTYTPSNIDILAGSVVIGMVTTGNGSCKPASAYVTLTIAPSPIVNAGADKSICGDSLGVPLDNASFANATGVQWSTSGSGVFGPNNTAVQPTYYPSPADKAAGSVRLAVVTTGNGKCFAASDTMVISITPVPTVNAGSNITVCSDTNGVLLNGSSTIAGGVQWSSSGSGIFTPNASLPAATYIPSNADTTAKSVTLTLTTTNNGTCKAVSSNVTLTIQPRPVVNAGSDNTICSIYDQLTLSGSIQNAAGGTWATNGGGTFSPDNTTMNANYNASPSDITAGSVTLTLTSTGSGVCKTQSNNTTLTFSPIPSISAGSNLQVCNSVSTISVNGSESNVSSVTWSILQGNGTLSSPNSLNTTYNVGAGDITSGVTLQITGTVANGCRNVSDQMTISFVSAPPINAGPNATVCVTDFPIQLQATGSTAQWSNYTGTFNPNDQTLNALYTPSAAEVAAGSVTLSLTTTNNGLCAPNTSQVTYTLVPGPVVTTGAVPAICANTPAVSLSGTSNGISTGVQWSTSGSGTFTNGTAVSTSYTPSPGDIAGGSVVLTISSTGNGVCNAAASSTNLVIQPQPAISAGGSQTMCADAATVSLNATFSNATGVQWSVISGGGTFANPAAAATQYNVVSADTSAGSVTLQAAVTGQNPACAAATSNMTVTFTRIPTVSAGPPIVVCTDTATIPLNGNVSIAKGGTWSTSGSGFFAPSKTTLNSIYIPSAADRLAGTVTLKLTTTGNGTCNAYSSTAGITFNPRPTLSTTPSSDTICASKVVVNTVTVNATATNTGSIKWITTGTGTFSNPTASPSVYTPSLSDINNGGVILYATTVGSAPCREIQSYMSITILNSPQAIVNAGMDQTACADEVFFPLNGTISGVATGGFWTSSSGLGQFYPDNTDLTPVFVPDPSDVTAGGLTLFLTSTGNGICGPSTGHMRLTITPAPTVKAGTTPASTVSYCSDTAFVQLTPTITGATGGVWATSGTGYFSPSTATLNAVYVPSAADRKSGLVGLTITTTGNGTCNSYSDYVNIKLTPSPTVNIGPDQTVCADASVNLQAVITVASGVNWTSSGTGIFTNPANSTSSDYIFSDADTTNKVLNIFAATVNQGTCKPAYDTLKVTIQPVPVILPASASENICADTASITVRAGVANAAGISWSTNGSGTFTPNGTSNPMTYKLSAADKSKAAITLYATSTNSGVCTAVKDSTVLNIAPVPVVSAGSPVICDTVKGATLNGSVLHALGGVWSTSSGKGVFAVNNNTLNAVFIPNASDIAAGKVNLILTSTGNGTCKPVSASTTLLILPLPIANAGSDQFVCMNSNATVQTQSIQTGINYSWINKAGTTVAPANSTEYTFAVPASTYMVLKAVDNRGCTNTDTVNINTFTLPTLTPTPNPACVQQNLMIQANPGIIPPPVPGIYQWFDNGTIMTGKNKAFLIVSDTGTYKIEYSYGNCAVSAQTTVRPVPAVTASDITACGKGILTASVSNPANAAIAWSLNGAPAGNTAAINISSMANDTLKYYVTATNPVTNCSVKDSAYVIGLPVPVMRALDSTSCQGAQVHLTAVPTNITGLNQFLQLTYKWKNNTGAVFSTDSVVNVNAIGKYVGTITIGQCIDSSVNNIAFAAYPTSKLPATTKYCADDSLTAPVILNPGLQPNTTYKWSTGAVTDSITVKPPTDQTYSVTITNKFNCTIKDSTLVRVICKPRIDIPNAFLPGQTGTHDYLFRAFGKYVTNYKLMVFNRWGEVIFISHELSDADAWDGTYKGEPMPSGVYPWVLTYEGFDEYKGPYKKEGSVTIIYEK